MRGRAGRAGLHRALPVDAARFLERPGRRAVTARPTSSASRSLAPRRLAALTEHGGIVIHGRSDAMLNPGGVRIGTARDLLGTSSSLHEIVEALAVGQRLAR